MTDPLGLLVLGLSLTLTALFMVYGFNSLYLYLKSRESPPSRRAVLTTKPAVAVHLPVYNEVYVIERLIVACVRMAEEYGRNKVTMYVIDDSTDETTQKLHSLVSTYKGQGYKFEVIRRQGREGFKAGALQAALNRTWEDYAAVLDADFVPPTDFLDKTVAMLEEDSNLGFVQARWGHLDRDYNLITSSVAIGIDAHFLLEQQGRSSGGYLMAFNGSAGVLRCSAIRKVGGWDGATLTEDLDLSYRMQLAGYKGAFLKDLKVPGELSPSLRGLKRQQGRWARGYMQTAKKLLGQVRRSDSLSRGQKVEAGIHLTGYVIHPLIVASFLLVAGTALTSTGVQAQTGGQGLALSLASPMVLAADLFFPSLLIFSTLIVVYFSAMALRVQGLRVSSSARQMILLILLAYGMSISNSIHALAGLASKETGEFFRTPKYAVTKAGESWKNKDYQISFGKVTVLEAGAVVLATLAIQRVIITGNFVEVPVLLMYFLGYLFVLLLTFQHSAGRAGRMDI